MTNIHWRAPVTWHGRMKSKKYIILQNIFFLNPPLTYIFSHLQTPSPTFIFFHIHLHLIFCKLHFKKQLHFPSSPILFFIESICFSSHQPHHPWSSISRIGASMSIPDLTYFKDHNTVQEKVSKKSLVWKNYGFLWRLGMKIWTQI